MKLLATFGVLLLIATITKAHLAFEDEGEGEEFHKNDDFMLNDAEEADGDDDDDDDIQISAVYDDDIMKTKMYQIQSTLNLQCNASELGENHKVIWRKDGQPLADRFKMSSSNGIYSAHVRPALETDAGNYTCSVIDIEDKVLSSADIRAASHIKVKVPDNINVVEGEKLRIHCVTYGNPPPEISWNAGNETGIKESTGRYILEDDPDKGLANAVFVINAIEMEDRGEYECIGYSALTKKYDTHKSMVRVKDKYAALWPFLGICAEVFVLCAIIFIYEKKRNKTELEESDTDQSPDQKNTPDHGKDSNLRHRQ